MIVISTALLMGPLTPLTHSRIGWQNHIRGLTIDDVTVSTETAGGPRDAPLRPDTAEYWQGSAVPATWKIDLGSVQDVDYIGIAGHTIGSEGGTLLAEVSVDDAVYTTFASSLAPADNSPIMFLDVSQGIRWILLTVSVAAVAPKIAVVYAGEALAMQRATYGGHKPANLTRETTLKRQLTRGGQYLGQEVRRRGVLGSPSYQNLTAAWYRSEFDRFVQSARLYPYFFAWRPSSFPLEVAYAWSVDDIGPSNMGKRDLMEVSWKFDGIGYE